MSLAWFSGVLVVLVGVWEGWRFFEVLGEVFSDSIVPSVLTGALADPLVAAVAFR
jgi:hypothetical protein